MRTSLFRALHIFLLATCCHAKYEKDLERVFNEKLKAGHFILHDLEGNELSEEECTKIQTDVQKAEAITQFLTWGSHIENIEAMPELKKIVEAAIGEKGGRRSQLKNDLFNWASQTLYSKLFNSKMLEKRLKEKLNLPLEEQDRLPKATPHSYSVATKAIMACALYDARVVSEAKGNMEEQLDKISSYFYHLIFHG